MSAPRTPAQEARTAQVLAAMLETDAFSRWLGIRVVSAGAGRSELHMHIRHDMVNGFGAAHGGITYSLADSALAFACNGGEHVTVAVDNQVSYPAPVHVGDDLVATAEEESRGGRLGFYRVTVRNQHGTVVALFRGTVYRTSTLHPTGPAS
ncbi:MAG: hydroxyphenylacetyl-CoA thioesterase PaaI [Gemmatimonadaceae bacterium]|nr:hydroxyphenylacetyl-CoA thioesterase PaaI [Gemmatimonadaceae bacterium]